MNPAYPGPKPVHIQNVERNRAYDAAIKRLNRVDYFRNDRDGQRAAILRDSAEIARYERGVGKDDPDVELAEGMIRSQARKEFNEKFVRPAPPRRSWFEWLSDTVMPV